ncbi:citrate synthase I [Besnoitia besnoiti]|uniref:Citrate synthase n=1 Tax=Besnoitia besnoiti TaxID=94643 RepID=A0A2A9MIU4_BESBE|nr:citrate synthase I [Besnoitia besnoiti]PFH35563.1 citrate synthase I [Besnoitia besnoiti]
MLFSRLRDTAAAALALRTGGASCAPSALHFSSASLSAKHASATFCVSPLHRFFSSPSRAALSSPRVLAKRTLFRHECGSCRGLSTAARSVCGSLSEAEAHAAVEAGLEALAQKIEEAAGPKRELLKKLRKDHGNLVVSEATVNSVCGGMRGLTAVLTETSALDPEKGILFRGLSINECMEKLPRLQKETYPAVEGLIWLLMTGSIPTAQEVQLLSNALYALSLSSESASPASPFIPLHVHKALDAIPTSVHPMTQLVLSATALQTTSQLADACRHKKVKKQDLWKPALADALSLIAKNGVMAARIYQRTFDDGKDIDPQRGLDWAANFAHMMGFDSENHRELFRLYLFLHADHEGGNVSAHAAHVVGSALSDPFLSFAAGMAGLAGPLHGLANQECLKWLLDVHRSLGGAAPTPEKVRRIAEETLASGRVIPGYGHAVLRVTDPRFTAQREFALKYLKDDELFKLLDVAYRTIPDVLLATGKVKNPYPNVDCHSGVLLQHFGITEPDYYTVLFGVSRAIGIASQYVWARILGLPIERPKSTTLDQLEALCEAKKN